MDKTPGKMDSQISVLEEGSTGDCIHVALPLARGGYCVLSFSNIREIDVSGFASVYVIHTCWSTCVVFCCKAFGRECFLKQA